MKFGKVLQQSTQMSPSAWEPYWADYKLLKKIIKDCAQIKKEEKLQGDKLVKIKIKPSAKEDNDSIRAWLVLPRRTLSETRELTELWCCC
ncbi:unnamed protein product [Phytophthora lilii]|uniref:Unnamed protein product n=1 Tax=Phytophthora lilii TaxID=2077276 RepID=A0A9W6WQQ7_9STRA|nr:unnamed protein product [Phytophthora lilii]